MTCIHNSLLPFAPENLVSRDEFNHFIPSARLYACHNQREGVDLLRFVCHRFSTECTRCLPFICLHVLSELQLLIFFESFLGFSTPSIHRPFQQKMVELSNCYNNVTFYLNCIFESSL